MPIHPRIVRTLTRAVPLTLLVTAATVIVAQPATAQPTYESAPVVWTYTDHRAQDQSFTPHEQNVIVGTWVDGDGTKHKSRSYGTFDLSRFAGKTIVSTKLFLRDDTAGGCADRHLEVWQTEVPAAPPTWRSQPPVLGLLGTYPCSAAGLDLAPAVRAALSSGQQALAIELRISDSFDPGEGDPSTARSLSWYYSLRLTVGFNTPPMVIGEHLYNNLRPCGSSEPYPTLGGPGVQLGAMLVDPDSNPGPAFAGEFAIWPVADPAARTVVTKSNPTSGSVNSVNVPAGILVDGGTYAWQARALDGVDTSDWSRTCTFHYDATRPASPPGVVAPNYRENEWNPAGAAPVFTFTPNGVDDVAAYQYSFGYLSVSGVEIGPGQVPMWRDPFDGTGFVRAGADGSATVTLPFPRDGMLTLQVASYDEAYHSSATRQYSFFVESSGPTITASAEPQPGQPVHLTLAPGRNVEGVVSYEVRVDKGAPTTVAAGVDGIARLDVTFGYGQHQVVAHSVSANGFVSGDNTWWVTFENRPTVTSVDYPANVTAGGVGVPGQFTFRPGPGGAVSYAYMFDVEGVWNTVAAGPDGTATISYTPFVEGAQSLRVHAIDASGAESDLTVYWFVVASPPGVEVTSATYPEWSIGGGPGVEGTFTFEIAAPNAVTFAYAFNQVNWSTVPVGADGTASVTFTPPDWGFNELWVYAQDASGNRISDYRVYYFLVADESGGYGSY